MKYKKSIVDKVLKHDLQSGNFNAANPSGKQCDDKNSKKPPAKGVVKQR